MKKIIIILIIIVFLPQFSLGQNNPIVFTDSLGNKIDNQKSDSIYFNPNISDCDNFIYFSNTLVLNVSEGGELTDDAGLFEKSLSKDGQYWLKQLFKLAEKIESGTEEKYLMENVNTRLSLAMEYFRQSQQYNVGNLPELSAKLNQLEQELEDYMQTELNSCQKEKFVYSWINCYYDPYSMSEFQNEEYVFVQGPVKEIREFTGEPSSALGANDFKSSTEYNNRSLPIHHIKHSHLGEDIFELSCDSSKKCFILKGTRNFTDTNHFEPNGIFIPFYKNNGTQMLYDSVNDIARYYYDPAFVRTKTDAAKGDFEIFLRVSYARFDEFGRKILDSIPDWGDQMSHVISYSYNNNSVYKIRKGVDGELWDYTKYVVDEHGNWIEKKISYRDLSKPTEFTRREITYYK